LLSRLGTLASRLGRQWSRSAPAACRETPEEIKDFDHAGVVLERILLTNLLSFWRSQVGDERAFGYLITNPDVRAQTGASLRGIVTQARTLWFYARIIQTPFADDSDGRQAERGFTFLAEHMWDHRHGGFYWHIDDLGRPVRGSKQLYGHAFALFALSRYAAASQSAGAIDLAHATFELLEQRFHDHDHPGYNEFFTADWREPPQSEKSQIGSPAGCKTYNSHLHVLEA
jgi:cellobiose epimerase